MVCCHEKFCFNSFASALSMVVMDCPLPPLILIGSLLNWVENDRDNGENANPLTEANPQMKRRGRRNRMQSSLWLHLGCAELRTRWSGQMMMGSVVKLSA